MSEDAKPADTDSFVVDVRLELLNINGRKSTKVERRTLISKYLNVCRDKPDFLALVDCVAKVDVNEFCNVLNKRWIEAKYEHMAYEWNGRRHVNKRSYIRNREALVYDSSIWEYLERDELPIRQEDFPKLGGHLWNRFREGVFRHKGTDEPVCVVTYHGPCKGTKMCMNESKKQECFSEFLTTLLKRLKGADLSPEPSLFVCGDFNFNVGRDSYSRILGGHDIQIFPQLTQREAVGGYSHKPLDYILICGRDLSVAFCAEYNILADNERVWSSPCFSTPLTLRLPIEKLGHDIERLLEEVTNWKRASRTVILDSECLQSLIGWEITNALGEDEKDSTRRESTPLKDIFDHNFVRMHARLGVRLPCNPGYSKKASDESLQYGEEGSDANFRYKSPRPQPASVLPTITVKANGVSQLREMFSGDSDIWSHKSLWLRLRMDAISVKSQNRIYRYISDLNKGVKGENWFRIRIKDI